MVSGQPLTRGNTHLLVSLKSFPQGLVVFQLNIVRLGRPCQGMGPEQGDKILSKTLVLSEMDHHN